MVSDENLLLAIQTVNRTHRSRRGIPNKTVLWVESDVSARIETLRSMLCSDALRFSKPKERQIYDRSACKVRTIHQPRIWPDQYLHHAVIQAAMPVMMRGMDFWCCGSIKGRGAARIEHGMKKWMGVNSPKTRWALEADIHHFYESLKPDVVMQRLRKLIKDERFLDVCRRMMEHGITIGTFFSQWFANTVLQELDQAIRRCGVDHYVRYMDNITITCSRKKTLRKALSVIRDTLAGMQLQLKDNWQIFRTSKREIRAVGRRFGNGYTLLRKLVLLRVKRIAATMRKRIEQRRQIPFRLAAGFLCRVGVLRRCSACRIIQRYIMPGMQRIAKRVIREGTEAWTQRKLLNACT